MKLLIKLIKKENEIMTKEMVLSNLRGLIKIYKGDE